MIKLNNLTFRYNKNKEAILNDVSYTFSKGKLYHLKGDNGSGKTTLSKLIMNLLPVKKGEISIFDEDLTKLGFGVSQKIGYLFQVTDFQLFAPTVIEELTFPFELNNTLDDFAKVKIRKALERTNLIGFEKRFPLTMSGGEKKRLAIATLLCRDVEFIILDEPSANIDKVGREFLADFINEFVSLGGGCIIISHDEEFLELLNIDVTTIIEKGGLL